MLIQKRDRLLWGSTSLYQLHPRKLLTGLLNLVLQAGSSHAFPRTQIEGSTDFSFPACCYIKRYLENNQGGGDQLMRARWGTTPIVVFGLAAKFVGGLLPSGDADVIRRALPPRLAVLARATL